MDLVPKSQLNIYLSQSNIYFMKYFLFKNGKLIAIRKSLKSAISRFQFLVENNSKNDYFVLYDEVQLIKTN